MWILVAVLGMVVVGQALQRWRRRTALNRGLHELRRPLQALALAGASDQMELVLAALEGIDREVNGGGAAPRLAPVRCRELLDGAAGRCQARAATHGAEISTRWMGGSALVVGDRVALAAALDNLLVNAIEHGGPRITISGSVRKGRLRMAVVDDGTPARRAPGGPRHGHGLGVVRSVATEHGGRFALQRSGDGAVAMLELPLAPPARIAA